ncbi:HAD-IB family phosphatase [Bosea sp. NPDC055332]
MKDLCVFDLDGTLIAHDSFAELVRQNLTRDPLLLAAALLRRLRLLDRAGFATQAHRRLGRQFASRETVTALCARLQAAVIADRLALLDEWKARGATTVLLSASPNDYVEPLGRLLGFDHAFGSSFVGGAYQHLHGEGKLRFIDERFPAATWRRAFAIADHPSDDPLLARFEQVLRV